MINDILQSLQNDVLLYFIPRTCNYLDGRTQNQNRSQTDNKSLYSAKYALRKFRILARYSTWPRLKRFRRTFC